ncbi:MAG TPA: FRG domain-containing protein [Terriglobales bacterium]|jgi:hypothetical protein|nr:FRG domain-containing protein [Terriglobales bacterium]
MNGYWYGIYTGSNSGQIVVEVDDMGDHFYGSAYVYDNNPLMPSTWAEIKTPNKSDRLQFQSRLLPLHPDTGEFIEWHQITGRYPGVTFPKQAAITCEWSNDSLKLEWRTDIGTHGAAQLPRSQIGQPSVYEPLPVTTWQEFKHHVTQREHYRYIYRGQTKTSRLCTPFHRTGRGDTRRYMAQDIRVLHAHLSARTSHFFDLRDPIQNAAFFHLVQHHGYPTPLLDWTYSPFVAAYFAYHPVKSLDGVGTSGDRKVRIFVFDKLQWCLDFAQITNMSARWQHFSILEPAAIENERMVPQQALSSFTTVDDIETYIRSKEEISGKLYLEVIDLPLRERDHVIRELRLMGITQGSLFPGLDGACEELRERFFGF